MATSELDKLRALADYADQICGLADSNDEARHRISQLINRAEQDIKAKSLEIQLQQTHIALLKQLDGFMARGNDLTSAKQIRYNDRDPGGPRAISAEAG